MLGDEMSLNEAEKIICYSAGGGGKRLHSRRSPQTLTVGKEEGYDIMQDGLQTIRILLVVI